MPAKTFCATLNGLDAEVIEVEVNVSSGLPHVQIVGLVDTSIRESQERIRACLKNASFKFPIARVVINLAPGNIFKYGTQFDLSIAVGLLVASQQLPADRIKSAMFVGELALDGTLRPVPGVLAMVIAAKHAGLHEVYLPEDNLAEASLVKGIGLFGCTNISEVIDYFTGKKVYLKIIERFLASPAKCGFDFADISGQPFAKRGMEIAAAGGHNILLKGPPGSGKTLLAQAIPSILPEPSTEEFLEIAKIYSAAGFISGEIQGRPFRNPSQNVTAAAFIGGGRIPKPGEMSLSHHGVLFLDEFPEFPRGIIESLRQPLENGRIKVARIQGEHTFPARFILVAAANPCPCGFYGEENQKCACSPGRIHAYRRKISGPILDRIDLQVSVRRADLFASRNTAEESSARILERVQAARIIQNERRNKLNRDLSLKELRAYCRLNHDSEKILQLAGQRYYFSARTHHRILRVARTIADLSGHDEIRTSDLAESIQYRLSD